MHISSSRHSPTARGRIGIALLALLVPLAACAPEGGGQDPERAPTTASPSPATTGEEPGGYVPGPAGPDDPGTEEGAVLAWLPPGPASPNDPAPDRWYGALQARDCDRLAAAGVDREVWSAAIKVCRALETGTPAAWEEAAAALEGVPRPDDADCLDLAVYDAMLRALRFREEHPTTPEVSVEASAGAACPVQLTGLSTDGLDIEEDPVASTCGGDRFRLMGRLLSVSAVTVGSVVVEAEREEENRFWFVAPPGSPGVVKVTVEAEDGLVPGAASFTYLDASPCSGPSPTPTDVPGASPSPTATPDPTAPPEE